MKRIALLLTVPLLLGVGCSSEKAAPVEQAELAAQVGKWVITRQDVQLIVDQLPEAQRERYQPLGGRAVIADRAIEQEIYHQEGLKSGYHKDAELLKQVDEYKRSLIVGKYFEDVITERAKPTVEEVRDFYDANQHRYTKMPIVRAQHIFAKSPEKLVDLKKRIEAGESMTTLARHNSEDQLTAADGGDLGYFNPNGYIRGMVGNSSEISDVCFALEVGEISDPIAWEKGYSLIRVTEYRPEELRPFDEVRADIENDFVTRNIDEVKARALRDLRTQYTVTNYIEDELKLTMRTDSELWSIAQNTTDTFQRIASYQEIVDRFPDSERAPDALFMLGFVSSEELGDKNDARRAFRRLLDDYPDAEVTKTARWMIDNLDKPLPKFDSIDELTDKIPDDSGK